MKFLFVLRAAGSCSCRLHE